MSSNLKVNTILPSTGTTIGIGTVGGLINVVGNIDVNSTSGISTFNGLEISGIVTAKAGAAVTYYGDGSNLTSLPAANLTGTLPAISGANLTNLPAQATIANNADNRIITGGSGVNLNGEANLTFDGSLLTATNTGSYAAHIGGSVYYFKIGQTSTSSSPRFDAIGSNVAIPFALNGTEKIRIDLNGNLILGASTYQNGGFGGSSHGINIAGTQPQILLHETDTNKDGYFGLAGSILRIQTADAIPVTIWTSDTRRVHIHETTGDTTIETGNLVIGTSGKGIDFSATGEGGNSSSMSNEILSDYEEGTWVPVANGFTAAATYHANYTRIGRIVHITMWVQTASGTSGAAFYISGLPYTVKTGNVYQYACGRLGSGGHTNSASDVVFEFATGNTYIMPKVQDGGMNWGMASNTHVMLSGSYIV